MVKDNDAKIEAIQRRIKNQRKFHKEKEKEWKAERAVLTEANESTSKLLASEVEDHRDTKRTLVSLQNTPTQKEISVLSHHLEQTEKQVKQLLEQVEGLEDSNALLKDVGTRVAKRLREEKREVMLIVLQESLKQWQSDLLHQYLESLDEERTMEGFPKETEST